MSINAVPLPSKSTLYFAFASRCLSTLGRCFAVQINTFAFRGRSQVHFAVANAIHSKSVALRI
jgi:hypothetical protein